MGKKRAADLLESPVDLAARIGAPPAPGPATAAPEAVRRLDGPIDSDRAARRPVMIGANEPLPDRLLLIGLNEKIVARPSATIEGRPAMIGLEEAVAAQAFVAAALPEPDAAAPVAAGDGSGHREAPAVGEMDLVVTPLATPDDWHHFELALRRVPGVGPLRIEYYRAGILKLRLRWSGPDRFASAVAGVPGYRVGILGQDRNTVQIRVVRA
ncbi:MAG TPA: hypothetical protein VGA38_05015 [Candidatus Limnocylindria bacterium]